MGAYSLGAYSLGAYSLGAYSPSMWSNSGKSDLAVPLYKSDIHVELFFHGSIRGSAARLGSLSSAGGLPIFTKVVFRVDETSGNFGIERLA